MTVTGVQLSRVPDDRMSFVTKIARLHHEYGLKQPEIAYRLHISQSRVSRLLKEAVSVGIVRIIVVPSASVFPDLEEAVRDRFGIVDVVVVDPGDGDERALLGSLGSAGAAYLETTLTGGEHVEASGPQSALILGSCRRRRARLRGLHGRRGPR